MKIVILSSMAFVEDIMEKKAELERLGHSVQVPGDTQHALEVPDRLLRSYAPTLDTCVGNDFLRTSMQDIAAAESVLVLNHPKNGINGFVDSYCMMQIGVAYYLHKKIFLLYPLPPTHDNRFALDVSMTQPKVLNGDMTLIDRPFYG